MDEGTIAELRNENEQLRKINADLREALGSLVEYANIEIDKRWEDMLVTNIRQLEELKLFFENQEEALKQIEALVRKNREEAFRHFEIEFETLKNEAFIQFRKEISEFLETYKFDKDIDRYIYEKIERIFESLSNPKIEALVKGIYQTSLKKMNVVISEEIIKQVPDMSLPQSLALKNAVERLQQRKDELLRIVGDKDGQRDVRLLPVAETSPIPENQGEDKDIQTG